MSSEALALKGMQNAINIGRNDLQAGRYKAAIDAFQDVSIPSDGANLLILIAAQPESFRLHMHQKSGTCTQSDSKLLDYSYHQGC